MTPEEYIEAARKTLNESLSARDTLSMLGMGIAGEAGEVADIIKKVQFHDHTQIKGAPWEVALRAELGDLLWYIANLVHTLDTSFEELFAGNVAKLRNRYPGGFSYDKSQQRDEYKVTHDKWGGKALEVDKPDAPTGEALQKMWEELSKYTVHFPLLEHHAMPEIANRVPPDVRGRTVIIIDPSGMLLPPLPGEDE